METLADSCGAWLPLGGGGDGGPLVFAASPGAPAEVGGGRGGWHFMVCGGLSLSVDRAPRTGANEVAAAAVGP